MMNRLLRGVVSLGALWTAGALGAACSSGETVELRPPPYATESGFCTLLAEAVCNDAVVNRCYLSDDASRDNDRESCVAAVQASNFCNPDDRSYNPERIPVEDCIDTHAKIYEDGQLSRDELEEVATACDRVFNDGRAVGGSCEVTADCAFDEGLECVAKPGQTGTCQVPMVVGPGDSCAAVDQVCEPDRFCGSDLACVAKLTAGAPCDASRPCGEGTACIGTSCIELLPNGTSCTDDFACTGGFCIRPAGSMQGTCGSRIELASTNEYCQPFLP